jgi:hypothetical protein
VTSLDRYLVRDNDEKEAMTRARREELLGSGCRLEKLGSMVHNKNQKAWGDLGTWTVGCVEVIVNKLLIAHLRLHREERSLSLTTRPRSPACLPIACGIASILWLIARTHPLSKDAHLRTS